MSNGPIAADELRLLIERVERLEEEKKNIADDIKCVFGEAKTRGFDTPTMRKIIKLRGMDVNKRREAEALLDIYKGALGMLDGTPLGNWAQNRLDRKPPADDAQRGEGDDASDVPAMPDEPAPPPPPELTIEDARRMGSEAARAGVKVTRNPFPAHDARRAAWDEAWCKELGSDGMDIPDALKPTPKAKPADPAPDAREPAPKAGKSGKPKK